MRPLLVAIDSISEDPKNSRIHPLGNLKGIKASLARFGQQKAIVVSPSTNYIVAGNGTYRAAKELKWKEIWVVFTELTEEEAVAYGIADNQTGLTSKWDDLILNEQLDNLKKWNPHQSWDALGFPKADLESRIGTLPEKLELKEAKEEFSSREEESGSPADMPDLGDPIIVTKEQREFIEIAISLVRATEDDPKMSEGRCIELILAEWIGSLDSGVIKSVLGNQEDEQSDDEL